MNIEVCYQKLGGNYNEVSARIPGESLVVRFLTKFLSDPSFEELKNALDSGDRATAFRAAHTLKGVCANLSFEKLHKSSSELTEVLRPESDEIPSNAFTLMDKVKEDYQTTVDAIREYLAEE